MRTRISASNSIPLLVFDIHGVLMGRREPPGHRQAGEVIAALRDMEYPMLFLTNSSSKSPASLAMQLADSQVEVRVDEIYTGAMVVAHYLRSSSTSSRVYVIGSQVLRNEISTRCADCVRWATPEEADTVVVSRDPSLDDELLLRFNRSSLRLIATCRDSDFPSDIGREPGPGSTVSRVEGALNLTARVIGKPNTYVLTEVMGLSNEELVQTVIIGDSLWQDIALSRNAGTKSVLLQSDESNLPTASPWQPDRVFTAIDQLLELFQEGQ
jgi:HAD superfamily hydrolase (TIGR01450 family)